ncbi:MAG: hypothetical protein HY078_13245 [Elusimicrobia bacterium]|nr:hypothetical protein [Elusimicrobiota bacterium]
MDSNRKRRLALSSFWLLCALSPCGANAQGSRKKIGADLGGCSPNYSSSPKAGENQIPNETMADAGPCKTEDGTLMLPSIGDVRDGARYLPLTGLERDVASALARFTPESWERDIERLQKFRKEEAVRAESVKHLPTAGRYEALGCHLLGLGDPANCTPEAVRRATAKKAAVPPFTTRVIRAGNPPLDILNRR